MTEQFDEAENDQARWEAERVRCDVCGVTMTDGLRRCRIHDAFTVYTGDYRESIACGEHCARVLAVGSGVTRWGGHLTPAGEEAAFEDNAAIADEAAVRDGSYSRDSWETTTCDECGVLIYDHRLDWEEGAA